MTRTAQQIQRDGADILVVKMIVAHVHPSNIELLEKEHGVPPGAVTRVLQRIDQLQQKADDFDHLDAIVRHSGTK